MDRTVPINVIYDHQVRCDREWRIISDITVLDHICDPLRTESLHRVPEFRVRRSYFPIPQAHCNCHTLDDEKEEKVDPLVQFYTLIVLFLSWPRRGR